MCLGTLLAISNVLARRYAQAVGKSQLEPTHSPLNQRYEENRSHYQTLQA